ncbi:MAG: PDZ domain-containing protein [Paludisphaera borealis]|uniref:PDZ domain-containing protein n=1 Tax=Paludisphaera borealis TaxID=1387353 RepID=UPI002848DB02|nr:PDZ domain-containing protein [Paludisphaera borealis]MDR3621362.1 PDZ domain-containing protein [Paludisphaera borealis]
MKLHACILVLVASTNVAFGQTSPQLPMKTLPDELIEWNSEPFGMSFKLVDHEGSKAARLTASPEPESPASHLGLAAGDSIVALDGKPITTSQDFVSHLGRTRVKWIRRLDQQVLDAEVDVPQDRGERVDQKELRQIVLREINQGYLRFRPARVWVDNDVVHWDLGRPLINENEAWDVPTVAQAQVEVVRAGFSRPDWQRFWEPYLQRIESIIEEATMYQSLLKYPSPEMLWRYDGRIRNVYDEAARRAQATIKQPVQTIFPSPQGIGDPRPRFAATLTTSSGRGTILLMARMKYVLKTSKGNALRPEDWIRVESGGIVYKNGFYVYQILDPTGNTSEPKTVLISGTATRLVLQ